MHSHQLLGQLSGLHQMTINLMMSVPEEDCYRRFNPALPPVAWLLGRCVYLETYWLREVVQRDADMTHRVHALFGNGAEVDEAQVGNLPSRERLIHWALELQEENLLMLANPAKLPPQPLVTSGRLLPLLLQQQALLLEQMLAQLTERRLQLSESNNFLVHVPLQATEPSKEHVDIHRERYRIGAMEDPAALDNEFPPNVVELHPFRIDRHPVQNGAWLSFLQAGGYTDQSLWSHEGWAWKQQHTTQPHHWRQDINGHWFGIGLNGPFELLTEDAVAGINLYEAQAYANWVSSLGGLFEGAAVQHEYQWEVAARRQAITDYGKVWEWCANPFHRYNGYLEPEDSEEATQEFDAGHFSLRGGCLHSQRIQRRSSYRHHLVPEQRHHFCGTRLVFPPSKLTKAPFHVR